MSAPTFLQPLSEPQLVPRPLFGPPGISGTRSSNASFCFPHGRGGHRTQRPRPAPSASDTACSDSGQVVKMSASPPEFQKHPPGTRRQPLPASRFLLREQTIRLSYRTRKAASSWQRVTRPSARDASPLQPQARGVLRRRRLRAPDRSFRFSFRFKMAAAARQEKPCSQQSLKPAERLLLRDRKTHV